MTNKQTNHEEDIYDQERERESDREAQDATERYFTSDWNQMSPERGSDESDEDYEERMEDLDNF